MVNTSSVGRFAVNGMPLRLALRPLTQMCPSGRPSVRSVPGPVYFNAEYRLLFRYSLRAARLAEVRLPRRERIGRIEAAHARDRVPQSRDRLARRHARKDLFGPAGARRRDDRPVRVVARHLLAERPHLARGRLQDRADQIRRLALKQIGIVRADREDGVPGGARARRAPSAATLKNCRTNRAARA